MARVDHELEVIARTRRQLLEWYTSHRRDLPWRHSRDPYAIWVSEIMLQQTRVAVVVERYLVFMDRFPTVVSLALASEQDVLALWSGLGYYRRARMLHKAARFVTSHREGASLPTTSAELRLLPGIGAYTAAAIASIAHGERVAVIDGNVERVLCRLQGWDAGSRSGGADVRHKIEARAAELLDPGHPGDFNQAMMELGATVCTPRNPRCLACPLAIDCRTRGEHKTQPRPRMLSHEVACALTVRTGRLSGASFREVLLEQRLASETVMPGMWQLPVLLDAAVPESELRMTVRHAIMQVNYYVRVRTVFEDDVDVLTQPGGERRWVPLIEAAGMALTGLTRKVLSRAHLLPVAPLDTIAPMVVDGASEDGAQNAGLDAGSNPATKASEFDPAKSQVGPRFGPTIRVKRKPPIAKLP
jgi:A/G-specific adenine glycosylase